MKLAKYYPGREMDRLEDRVSRIFGDFLPAWWRETETFDTWAPAVDVYEDEKEFVIKAELPELTEKDIKVNVEGNVLTISGERQEEKEVKERNYHRRERFFGSFSRSFTLPGTIDREGIKAAYKDGVMKIHLPKKEEVKPREIKVEAA